MCDEVVDWELGVGAPVFYCAEIEGVEVDGAEFGGVWDGVQVVFTQDG